MGKTDRERDLIYYPIAIRATKSTTRNIARIREFEKKHGDLPDELLLALASSAWMVGFSEGQRDAQEDPR